MESLTITTSKQKLEGSVELPLSKSISNRGLIIAALSKGSVKNQRLSDADDTILLKKLLTQIHKGEDKQINCGNAGTTYRFLTALLAITSGEWLLVGDERMQQRPIGPLVNALKELGADISYIAKDGYPPLRIRGKRLSGGYAYINSALSSQFVSALMMIGPLMKDGVKLLVSGDTASLPYIYMTKDLMKKAGAEVDFRLPEIVIAGGGYKEAVLPYEADWSAAAFWYELMALSKGGELFLPGLKEDSIQGDSVLHRYFYMLGVETIFEGAGARIKKNHWLAEGFNFELNDHPDLAPSLVVTTAAKGFEGNFYGINGLKIKESDRAEALATELGKNGIKCTIDHDLLSFLPQKLGVRQTIDTYNDHRIAMAFAPLAILGTPVTINNPEVVSKSYPGFWRELQKVLN